MRCVLIGHPEISGMSLVVCIMAWSARAADGMDSNITSLADTDAKSVREGPPCTGQPFFVDFPASHQFHVLPVHGAAALAVPTQLPGTRGRWMNNYISMTVLVRRAAITMQSCRWPVTLRRRRTADDIFEHDTEMMFGSEAQLRLEAEHLEREAYRWRMMEELEEAEHEQDKENLQLK